MVAVQVEDNGCFSLRTDLHAGLLGSQWLSQRVGT